MDDVKYYLWLMLLLGEGSRAAVRLVRAAGSAEAVWADPSDELGSAAKVKPAVMDKLRCHRDLKEADDILSWCSDRNVTVLAPHMAEYPKSLLSLMDYPMVLFCIGKLVDLNSNFCCAVVGTRDMTDYGKKRAYDLGWGLADGGAVVVSGLALGVDGMAMAGAQSAGGVTVGVLGCGIDITYPPEHRDLFGRTKERGMILTEYPPGSPAAGYHFPQRNRIISGLCQATVVVEADMKSGSLITARHAVYQGRALFSVPGKVGEAGAEGTNKLLSEGASVVTNANDILRRYEFLYPHSIKPAGKAPIPDGDAGITAAIARVVSSVDPREKMKGGGIYGGRKKRSASKKPANSVPPEAAAAVKEKTEKLRHVHVDQLGELERGVWATMLPDTPMLPEEIGKGKYTISEVLTAMTLLEIAGAVEAGAGGYYIKCTGDDDDLIEGSDALRGE